MSLSVVKEKARCQRFREKFRTHASRKTPQSKSVEANISCLALLPKFSLQPMLCVCESGLLNYVAKFCYEKSVRRRIDSILSIECLGNARHRQVL